MREYFYIFIEWIARVHDRILHLNDAYEYAFSDKQLHFLVFGACGLLLFLGIHLLFKILSRWSITAISWIYAMTVMIVLTLVIEVGQKLTNTGNMELYDMLYGLWGFLLFFAGFIALRTVWRLLLKLLKRGAESPGERDRKRN